eukprot:CAMPEP_0198228190 /NCGR_PEP_ID=MMETSP1445-20131203/112224_1 /TAXON_ID=36898 /ORGANISM="Pyramimonas sp., Strain CCMP2087" /LENGTH=340 /DNA_ID=CAMNT_0043908473 /DNA_START=325 /DNA_END=1343 /DNA_ORIENTATION=+
MDDSNILDEHYNSPLLNDLMNDVAVDHFPEALQIPEALTICEERVVQQRVEDAVNKTKVESEESLKAVQAALMIDETLRIAAFTKERQRLQLAADRFKQQYEVAKGESERLRRQKKEAKQQFEEKELECLSLQSRIADLQNDDTARSATEAQLCAAISYSRQEAERLKSYVDEMEKEREEYRAASDKMPWFEATVAELEKAVEKATKMRQKASEVSKTEIGTLRDLGEEMRVKMMDYRHKYMTLQIQTRTADPAEYHQAITAALGTGVTVPKEASREQLWARVQAQEGQVTKMHDDNYQLKLRMEQLRWYQHEEKQRFEVMISELQLELQRAHRYSLKSA